MRPVMMRRRRSVLTFFLMVPFHLVIISNLLSAAFNLMQRFLTLAIVPMSKINTMSSLSSLTQANGSLRRHISPFFAQCSLEQGLSFELLPIVTNGNDACEEQ